MTENYLKVSEAAKILKVRPSSVYWRIKHGRIATKEIGGKAHVLVEDKPQKRAYTRRRAVISMPMTASLGGAPTASNDTMIVVVSNRANIKSLLNELLE